MLCTPLLAVSQLVNESVRI